MNRPLIVYADSAVKPGEIYLPDHNDGDVVLVKRSLVNDNSEHHFLTVNNMADIKEDKKKICDCIVSGNTAHTLGLDTGIGNTEYDFIFVFDVDPEEIVTKFSERRKARKAALLNSSEPRKTFKFKIMTGLPQIKSALEMNICSERIKELIKHHTLPIIDMTSHQSHVKIADPLKLCVVPMDEAIAVIEGFNDEENGEYSANVHPLFNRGLNEFVFEQFEKEHAKIQPVFLGDLNNMESMNLMYFVLLL